MQKKYINFGSDASSYDMLNFIIKYTNGSPVVIEGGTFSDGGGTDPNFIISPFKVITDDGFIIEETEDTVLTLEDTTPRNYTIVIEHIDNGFFGGTPATIQLKTGLYNNIDNCVILGWLLYTGGGILPSIDMLWESPRGLNTQNANKGWRQIIFPPVGPRSPYNSNSKMGSAGLYIKTGNTTNPIIGTPPDSYLKREKASFIGTAAENYNVSSYTTSNIYIETTAGTSTFTPNGAYTYTNATAADIVGDMNNDMNPNVSAVVHASGGNNYIKIYTGSSGSDASLEILPSSDSALLTELGFDSYVSTVIYGEDTLDAMYETYRFPGSSTYDCYHTVQFNLKEVPQMYEWRFTVPDNSTSAAHPFFKINYAKISINGTLLGGNTSSDIQEITETKTISGVNHIVGYKLRFLSSDLLENNLGGVLTLHFDYTIDTTTIGGSSHIDLINYHHALQQWAFPGGLESTSEAVNKTYALGEAGRYYFSELDSLNVGTHTLNTFDIDDCDSAIWDYTIVDSNDQNIRTGTVKGAWDSSGNIEYTETHTNDLGDTTDVSLSVIYNGGNIILQGDIAAVPAVGVTWTIKYIRTFIKE